MLNVAGILLNLLPIPPLDGFGIIAPWLAPNIRNYLYRFAAYGFLLVFIALIWIQPVSDALWSAVDTLIAAFRVNPDLARAGISLLIFGR